MSCCLLFYFVKFGFRVRYRASQVRRFGKIRFTSAAACLLRAYCSESLIYTAA